MQNIGKLPWVKRNFDVYYFMLYSIIEFPGIPTSKLVQLTYDEFGYKRFAKNTFEVQKLANLAQIQASERALWNPLGNRQRQIQEDA